MHYAKITGWGKCVPPAALTNEDLSTFLDTSDEWITSRTGIKERRICHTNFSDMAIVAAQHALAAADLDASELDLIILASLSVDSLAPNTSSIIQNAIGAHGAAAFDLNAACTGFLYGLHIGSNLIRTGAQKKVLVIGGELISYFMNWTSRDVAVLFGDAAGAAVIETSDEATGLLAARIGCDADAKEAITVTQMGSMYDRYSSEFPYLGWQFDGQEVFKRAVTRMVQASQEVLEESGLSIDDIDMLIPHQANQRIIAAVGKKLGIPDEKVFINVHKYGNTSAATIPVALTEALEEGCIKPGANILMTAFGAGLTWAAGVVKWGDRVAPINSSDATMPPCDKTALELITPDIQQYIEHQTKSEH